jgi:signal transduction histidine kinase
MVRPAFAGPAHPLVGGRLAGAILDLAAVQAASAPTGTAAAPGAAAPGAAGDARAWRRRARAESAAWTCAMAMLVGVTLEGSGAGSRLALDLPAAAASLALVAFLRRWPVPDALLLSALAALSPEATPPATLAALIVARWRPRPVALAVAGAGIGAHLVRGAWRPVAGLPYGWWAVLVCVAYAAIVGWGMLLRANQALISSLRDRAERAEADQARRVAEARAAERTRIAREMHDVLAHRLSLLATYAGALAYRPDAPPEQMSRAAEVIRAGAHEALDELREVIGVLRDDEPPGPADGPADGLTDAMRPLPGIADLPRLIEESRAAGMRIEAGGGAWPGDEPAPSCLPDAAGRTVYRVVQEGLTNVRKHAPSAAARVTLDGGPGAGLDVTIANRLAPASDAAGGGLPGAGTGLIGLGERLELAGGRLESGARGGEFLLYAWVPWPR